MVWDDQKRAKSLGRIIGLLLSVAWIYGWYVHLAAERDVALAAIEPCPVAAPTDPANSNSLVGKVKQGLHDLFIADPCQTRVRQQTSDANSIVSTDMWFVVLSTLPLFMLGRYLAAEKLRREIARQDATQRKQAERAARDELDRIQQADQQISEVDKSSRLKMARAQFIDRLGIVITNIDILADPKYASNYQTTKDNLAKVLHDFVKHHEPAVMTALIQSDVIIQRKLKTIDTGLKKHSITNDDLSWMLEQLPTGPSPSV